MKRKIPPPLTRWALVGAFLLSTLGASAHDLYWTEQKIIRASDIDGSNVVTVFDGSSQMDGVAVDVVATASHIYWTDHANSSGAGGVWRANRDGSGAQRLVVNNGSFNAPHYLAIDEANGRIFFSDYTRGIFRADLADGQNVTAVADEYSAPPTYTGIVQTAADRILFLTASNSWIYQVQFSEWSAGWPSALADIQGGNATYGLAYDEVSQTVYFADHNGGTLRSYNLSTSEAKVLKSGLNLPLGVKFSPSRTHLLIAERDKGISAYQFSNGGYDLLVPAPGAHFGVAVTADPGQLPDPPPPAADGETLFLADFQADPVGERIAATTVWTTASGPSSGSANVIEDVNNVFGFGNENRFLRVESANSFGLTANFEPTAIATFNFDFIGRYNPEDGNRWLNVLIRAGGANAHNTSIRMSNNTIRTDNASTHGTAPGNWPSPQGFETLNPSYGGNQIPLRLTTLVNNSADTITFTGPDGASYDLSAGWATVWTYNYNTGVWTRTLPEYQYTRQAGAVGGLMDNVHFQMDSGVLRSLDIDNISVVKGAHFAELAEREFPRYVDADFSTTATGDITRTTWGHFLSGNFATFAFATNYNSLRDSTNPDLGRWPMLSVEADSENLFGKGSDNRVLKTNGARAWTLSTVEQFSEEVITLRVDMVTHGALGGGRLTSRFWDETGAIVSRLEFDQSRAAEGFFRNKPGQWEHHVVNRFESVVNNSAEAIVYTTPAGAAKTLLSGASDMWINGKLAFSNSFDGRPAGWEAGKPIVRYNLHTFTTNQWNGDIDLVQTLPGVQLVPVESAPRDEPPVRDLLVYEGFNYNVGTLAGQNGGLGWAEGYRAFGEFPGAEVVDSSLTWAGLEVEGNRVNAAGPAPDSTNNDGARNFRNIDVAGIHSSALNLYGDEHIGAPGTTIWVSLIGQGNPDQSATFWGLSLYRNTDEQSGEVLFLGKGSADTEETGWRLAAGNGSGGGVFLTGVPLTQKAFWVVRIDYTEDGAQRASLFHNPNPAGAEPSLASAIGFIETDRFSYGFDRIRIAGNGAGFQLDEVRIGTTWAAVTPAADVTPGEGYAAWLEDHFNEAERADPSISGPGADPDGDGIANLIEYALGLNPRTPNREGLPFLDAFETIGENTYLTLTFISPDAVEDVEYSVKAGGDLHGSGADAVHLRSLPAGSGYTAHTYRDTQPVAAESRRFMWLSVTLP
jgi:hypothetical protein